MPAPAPWPTTTRESLTGTATCTPTSCTYDHFGDSSSYGTYEINGTISKSGDTLSFDLTLDVTSSELSFHWALDGSLTITDALLDGAIHSHGTATDISSSGGFDLTWDVDVAFRSIGLDVSGCAVSGSLSASVSFDETAPQGHYAYAAEGTVDFGPACGDVTIH
jgi:hypothetical protein